MKNNICIFRTYTHWQLRIQDFPLGVGKPAHWGHRPPIWMLFSDNVCKTQKLGPMGGLAPTPPPGSASAQDGSILEMMFSFFKEENKGEFFYGF